MVVIYVTAALVVLGLNFDRIPAAINAIVTGAFTAKGMSGGVLGIMILGFQRAAFSNEAGLGSAAIAHSAVQTDTPLTEGFVALLEPFIDTVVVCTLTGLVLITTFPTEYLMSKDQVGIALTSAAFADSIPWAPVPLSIIACFVCVLDDVGLGVLWHKGMDLYIWPRQTRRIDFQPDLLYFYCYRRIREARVHP